jgi:hypothetical protein
MYRFRFSIIPILLALLFFQCKSDKSGQSTIDINSHSWGTTTSIIIENGFYHSKKTLDTVNNQLIGDTLIPVTIHNSRLIIKKLEPLHLEMKTVDGINDFYITETGFKTDTFMYDVKKYFDRSFLILIPESSSSYVYELKDEHNNVPQTNNILFPRFEVEGYAVGDEVNRNEIQVLFEDRFGTSLTEEAVLANNENVLLQIIAGQYIDKIQWTNIDDRQAQAIVKELNDIFTRKPDLQFLDEENQIGSGEVLHYYWSENEVNILLSRLTDIGDLDNVWTLTYTNLIISNILNNYLDDQPENL